MPTPADRNLAREQFPDLNREFYTAEPGDYFRCRLRSLLLTISDSPAINEALEQGITYGKIGLRLLADFDDEQHVSLVVTQPEHRRYIGGMGPPIRLISASTSRPAASSWRGR